MYDMHMSAPKYINDYWYSSAESYPSQVTLHQVGKDFVGPIAILSKADDASVYILNITGLFMMWVEAIPTPDRSDTSISSALFKVLLQLHYSSYIIVTCPPPEGSSWVDHFDA